MEREEKKEKKEDEMRQINEDYAAYTEAFLNEFVYQKPPQQEVKEKDKKK